jgi:hypothetical protein
MDAADGNIHLYPDPVEYPPLIKCLTKYNKCVSNAGIWFWITHLLPLELSHVFWVLLDVVRPVETDIAVQCYARTKLDKLEMSSLYASRMWVSNGQIWTPEKLSNILCTWFSKGLGFKMGLCTYRQFSHAWQNQKVTPPICNESLKKVASSVAGHGHEMAFLNYGLRVQDHGQPQHKSEA